MKWVYLLCDHVEQGLILEYVSYIYGAKHMWKPFSTCIVNSTQQNLLMGKGKQVGNEQTIEVNLKDFSSAWRELLLGEKINSFLESVFFGGKNGKNCF